MADVIDALYEVEGAARRLVEGSTIAALDYTAGLIEALDALDRARVNSATTAEANLPPEYDAIEDGFAYPAEGS